MIRAILFVALSAQLLPAADHLLKTTPETLAWGYYWAGAKPVLTVKSGETVEVQAVSVGNPMTLERAGVAEADVNPDILRIYKEVPREARGPGGHPLTGPIFVEGAEPGDVLEIRIKEIKLRDPYAFNSTGGFLIDQFPAPRKTRIIPLDREKMIGHFAPGIDLPLRPFFGSIGEGLDEVGPTQRVCDTGHSRFVRQDLLSAQRQRGGFFAG